MYPQVLLARDTGKIIDRGLQILHGRVSFNQQDNADASRRLGRVETPRLLMPLRPTGYALDVIEMRFTLESHVLSSGLYTFLPSAFHDVHSRFFSKAAWKLRWLKTLCTLKKIGLHDVHN